MGFEFFLTEQPKTFEANSAASFLKVASFLQNLAHCYEKTKNSYDQKNSLIHQLQ